MILAVNNKGEHDGNIETAMFWHVFAPKKSCQGFAALSAPIRKHVET